MILRHSRFFSTALLLLFVYFALLLGRAPPWFPGVGGYSSSILWAIGFPFPQQHRSTRYVVGTLTQPHTIVQYRATWQGLWPLGIFGSRKSRSYRSVVTLCVCLLLLCSCAYPTLQEGELLIIQLFGSCVRSRLLHASIARKQRLSANVSRPKLDDGSRFLKVSHRVGSDPLNKVASDI